MTAPSRPFRTLAQALAEVGALYPDNGFTFQNDRGDEKTYRFPELAEEARRRAAALQRLGLRKGDRLGLAVIEPEHFVTSFLGAISAGIVPVPIYPPLYLGSLEGYFHQTEAILNSARCRILAVSTKFQSTLGDLPGRVRGLERVIAVNELAGSDGQPEACTIDEDDVVFLQYTSGSTMNPRGVMVTHRCLIANVLGFMGALEVDPRCDKGVTWLPLYHDMGLIGFVLGPLYRGISVVFIPTLRFVKNANVWMETIHAHRGTISFAPNFAYALAARRARPADLARWDLSCVKALGCGAEPIKPDNVREFARLFGEHCGLPDRVILPAYGLAEATLAVTMKPLTEPLRFRRIDSSGFEEDGVARDAEEGSVHHEHVSCGRPFPGHKVAIFDADGIELPDASEGEICVSGPSIAAGYAEQPDAWNAIRRGEWLRTGDLGYLAGGELHVTGRIKDLIILNGRNIHPQAIEWVVSRLSGVRADAVVAFSRPGASGEELVIVAEMRNPADSVLDEIDDAVQRAVFVRPAEIVCVKPGALPKTSSGKLKRQEARRQYLSHAWRAASLSAAAGED